MKNFNLNHLYQATINFQGTNEPYKNFLGQYEVSVNYHNFETRLTNGGDSSDITEDFNLGVPRSYLFTY